MANSNKNISVQVKVPGREEVSLILSLDENGQILSAKLHGIGGPEFLDCLVLVRGQLRGRLKEVPLPEGSSTAAVILREVLLKAKGEWSPPYTELELCHCRAVPTDVVDMAIVTGAHTPEKVSHLTSASTACGTCRPDVEALINYRLKKSV